MRSHRSAKFAEYISTFAILNSIGIHETVLIERRDSSTGIGVYVRDACDAHTTLFVVPGHRVCSSSVLSHLGTKITLRSNGDWDGERLQTLNHGLINYLTGLEEAKVWMECAWRIALERHRSYSSWWGWIQSAPDEKELMSLEEGICGNCRVLHPTLYPFYLKGRAKIKEEIKLAFELLSHNNLRPSFSYFSWAVEILLSRGILLPCCWQTKEGLEKAGEVEFGVVPFVDLINGANDQAATNDSFTPKENAVVEVELSTESLPEWYVSWVVQEARRKTHDESLNVGELLREHFCLCVSLTKPLKASEEVIISYNTPHISTGVLSSNEDALLSRLIKYSF
ncbi:unnamed protein product [Phytomonas sp. Hart1]|nr:unnamed protein product [Phytomonas sp. Hart1]|eukprot:CCW66429.1 unnamed protein product [Phytomonas sp. isolate Hart1]